jgi:hypothetical protein
LENDSLPPKAPAVDTPTFKMNGITLSFGGETLNDLFDARVLSSRMRDNTPSIKVN